jgi:hypothetical protein
VVTPWPHEGIAPLEVWDALAGDRTLFARRDEPAFFEHLAEVAFALRRGEAAREGGARLPPRLWGSVALVGGRVDEARARAAFGARGAPIDLLSADPFFSASAAARRLGARGAVIDVGQTALKAKGPGGQVHQARRPAAGEEARERFVDDIAAALAGAIGGAAPSGVLFALPCEVEARDGALWLGASSYPTEGEGAPILEACLAKAGVAGVPAWVVNDAVLAAWATVEARGRGPGRLVFTVGFGVGAACVEAA